MDKFCISDTVRENMSLLYEGNITLSDTRVMLIVSIISTNIHKGVISLEVDKIIEFE